MKCINLIHDRPYVPAVHDCWLTPIMRWKWWQVRRFMYFGGESCQLRRVDDARALAAQERIDMIDLNHLGEEA